VVGGAQIGIPAGITPDYLAGMRRNLHHEAAHPRIEKSPNRTPRKAGKHSPRWLPTPDEYLSIEAAASSLGIQSTTALVHDDAETEQAIDALARQPNGGLIVPPGAELSARRALILKLTARHRLPAVYSFRHWVANGGLMSYGPDVLDLYRRPASYVDRILKGAKPADLPIQQPTKFELVINLKTE
jgi:ABC transporter substrate binding protein